MKIVIICLSLFFSCLRLSYCVISDELLDAIITIETNWDHTKIGDKNRVNKSFGLFQIRKDYLTDVNRVAGRKRCMKLWGKPSLTLNDVRYSHAKARWAVQIYLQHYGKRYTKLTGLYPTAEVYSRIHNGGPNGWKSCRTLVYWEKIREVLYG